MYHEISNTERDQNARKGYRGIFREMDQGFRKAEAQRAAGSVEARRLANLRHLFSMVRRGRPVQPDEALRQVYGLATIIPLRQAQHSEVDAR